MAFGLPAELDALLLSVLDPFAFQQARQTCAEWQDAAAVASVLHRQIAKLPLVASCRTQTNDVVALQGVWRRAARELLLNALLDCEVVGKRCLATSRDGKVAFASDPDRVVSLDARVITMYSRDRSSGERIISGRVSLNDVRTEHREGPILRNAPNCVFELALGDKSNLVVIALDRIIQIYDLDRPQHTPAAAFVSAAAGHFITGVAFAEDDRLIRISLSNKGVVLYLGSLHQSTPSLEYWKSSQGLKNLFLSSNGMQLADANNERLACLQILRALDDRIIFASQRHSAVGRLGYVLGLWHPGRDAVATILAEFPLSHPKADRLSSFWATRPLAKEQARPRFCLSSDEQLLAVVEEGSSHFTPARTENKLFVWRFPSHVRSLLTSDPNVTDEIHEARELADVTHRVPLYLGDLPGTVLAFDFSSEEGGTYQIDMETSSLRRQVVIRCT